MLLILNFYLFLHRISNRLNDLNAKMSNNVKDKQFQRLKGVKLDQNHLKIRNLIKFEDYIGELTFISFKSYLSNATEFLNRFRFIGLQF